VVTSLGYSEEAITLNAIANSHQGFKLQPTGVVWPLRTAKRKEIKLSTCLLEVFCIVYLHTPTCQLPSALLSANLHDSVIG